MKHLGQWLVVWSGWLLWVPQVTEPQAATAAERNTARAAGRTTSSDASQTSRPSFKAVEQTVRRTLASFPDYRPGDVLDRRQVQTVLTHLNKLGWRVPESAALIESVLPDDSFLVAQLRSPQGFRFMRKTGDSKRLYDRLDRITQQPGGPEMVRDLLKLPDADRYAAEKPPRGVPDLLDLLPKQRSGRKRTIKDYDKSTGRIYNEAQLIAKLRELYDRQGKTAASSQISPKATKAESDSPPGQVIINHTIRQ